MNNGSVYLISKLRTSSEHVELWSYYLYASTLKEMVNANRLSPFALAYNHSITENYVPSAVLTWRASRVEIDYVGSVRIAFRSNADESHQFLLTEIQRSLQLTVGDPWSYLSVARDEFRRTIGTIVDAARAFEEKVKKTSM